jgi:hypothetical protein
MGPRTRRIPAACCAALLIGVSACGDDGPPTYSATPRPVRTLETPLPDRPVRLGEIVYSVMGIRTGVASVVGSHGDWLPKGQYVRLRIAVVNEGRERHSFEPSRQLLVGADGTAYRVSRDAMNIDRQPVGVLSIARDERREFDLWFDIPKTVEPRTLRVVGDATSSALGEQLKGPAPGARNTADISLSS